LAGEQGQRRKKRELWFGVVSDSIGVGLWSVTWENGRTTEEKSSKIQLQQANASREPLLELSSTGNTTMRPPRNEDEDLIDRPSGPAMVFLVFALPMPPLPTTYIQAKNEGAVQQQGRPTSSSPPSITPPSNEVPSRYPYQGDEEVIPNVNADSESEEEPEFLDVHGRTRVAALHLLS